MMKTTTFFRPRFALMLLAFLGSVSMALAAGRVSGRVFLDCNRNGIRETNEIGFAGERVTLSGTTSTGQAFSRTFLTSADGIYAFNGIPDGTYSLLFTMPLGVSGLSFSPVNQGNNDTLDSDVNANGRTANTLNILGNTNLINIDAGVIDTEAPQITALHPSLIGLQHLDTLTMRCDSAILFNENSVRVTDNSGYAVSLHFTDLGIVANGDCRRDGFISLVKCVWRAIDTCGNFSEWVIFMRIVDNNPPTILNVPADLTVNTTANIPNVPSNITAVDACSGAIVPTFQQTENGNIITRRWTATDNCGNSRVAIQNIRINGSINSDTCRTMQRDTIRLTLQQGQILDTCFNRITTVNDWQICQQSAHIAALLRGGNCLRFEITDAQFNGTETVCFNRGNCQQVIFVIRVEQPTFPPCNFLGQRTYTATLNDCSASAVFCVTGSNDLNDFRNNFSITDNGNPYNATIEGCNFDTIFTYTYFAIPNMGNRPPYRLDYWEFNGNRYIINPLMSVRQLVDSMNIWDNSGNWQLDTMTFSIFGGNPRNNYGDIRITRLENGAIGNMQLNTGLISRGVGLMLYAGNHLLVLRGRQTGCADTLQAVITCNSGSRPVPVAMNDTITTRFNTSVAFNPTANDTLRGSTFTVNILHTPRFGTIGWVGFDSMVYIPQRNFCGRDTMTYRVCNEFSLCDTAQIFFNVRCEGDTTTPTHPIAVDDNITTTRNTSLTFAPLSNDRINGILTGGIAFVSAPRHGSMGYASDSTLVYTPNQGYCGRDTFEYRICNERFLCDTATVFITISCDSTTNNLRPDAINDVATVRSNSPTRINVLQNDIPNGTLVGSVQIIRTPQNGSASVANNEIIYTSNNGFCNTNDTLTYSICNRNGCDTAQVVVTVNCDSSNNNQNPLAVDDNITTTRNTSLTFAPLSNDRINGILTGGIAFVSAPRHGSIGYASDSTLIYTPNQGYCGRDTFEYRICNERFLCDTATVFITISCDSTTNNLRPDAINDVATVRSNSPTRINVLQNDIPNGTLVGGVQIIRTPQNGSASVANNEIIYTSNNGFCNANDTLTYSICNRNGCDTAQVVVTVNCDSSNNNQNPLAVDDYILTRQNTAITFAPLSNDRINGVLTGGIAFVSAPRHGSIGYASDSTLIYTPNQGYCGRDTFEYRICNERFLCDTATVYITIICDSTNNRFRPNAVDDSITVVQGNPTSINVLQNDISNGTLIGGITIVQTPRHGSATVVNNQIVYTSDSSYCNGNDTLTYSICNASACDTAQVVIRVNCRINNLLDAVNDSARVVRGGAVTINILSNDRFDTLRFGYPSIVRRPAHGRATIEPNGNLIYLSDSVFCGGKDTLTYEICNLTACDTAMVVIHINCDTLSGDTSRLIANLDTANTFRNRPVTIAVLGNDSTRSGVETMRIVEQTRNGIAILNADRTILYRPNGSFCGHDTLIYEICNRRGCDTAIVFIQVFCRTSLNDTLPLAVYDTISTARATPIEIDVLRNDTLNAPTLSQFNLVSNPRRGVATIMINNQIRYTPDSSFCGVDSLIYEICNLFGCDTAIVRIRVVCQNVPRPTDTLPIAVLDTAIVQINVPRQIDILVNDTLRGAIQPELIRGAMHGLASITTDNKVLYVPDNNYCGTDTLTYRICNAVGCDTALVIITIPCGNDLFVFTGFSPNGDVQNEFLRIRGIENYVDSEVTIFNRWGTEVFYTRDYQNNLEKAFVGKWQGKDLPDGTYFCCIRDAKGLTLWLGFIQIRR